MKHILLIEDNPDVRENTAEILELAGYKVTTAQNGKEGVEAALANQPDLIICDIMMPVLDGYGVLHLLAKNDPTAGIPFIFLTAKSERSDMRKGMEMGADDYITKPFDDIELLNAVESRLKKAEMMKREVPATREGVTELLQNIHGIEDIAAISGRQQVRQLHKKDIIYSEGDSPAGLYLLTKGKAKVYKSHELGKDLILRMLHEGDFFGYLALLEGGTHAETAEAIEDGEVVIFPREDFFNLLEHSPVVMQQVIRMLSGSIADEHERLLLLAYSSVRKRTAEALLRLRLRFHDGTEQPFSMAIAREDLANMVGTATESLIRTLSDFREEGIVAVQGSTITVLDVSKLERMKN
ncbi:MAG: response regulator [Flavobacteriales bacterium]|jgi:CRP-like cAMP-binding protein/CheY-like chemotaxis protein